MYGFPDFPRHLNCEHDHARTLASGQASYSFTKADVAGLFMTYQQLEQPAKGGLLGDINLLEISSARKASDQTLSSNGCVVRLIC